MDSLATTEDSSVSARSSVAKTISSDGTSDLDESSSCSHIIEDKLTKNEDVDYNDILNRVAETVLNAASAVNECLMQIIHRYRDFRPSPVSVLKSGVSNLRRCTKDVHATFAVLGHSLSGKTSVVHSLVGCKLLPSVVPSRIMIKWTHVVGRTIPKVTISPNLHAWLTNNASSSLCMVTEGDDKVRSMLMQCRKEIIAVVRREKEDVSKLKLLCDIRFFVEIEVAFVACNGDKAATISLLDLPSPHLSLRKQYHRMFKKAMEQSHGIYLVVDASHNRMDDMAALVIDFVDQDRFPPEDVYIVANCIDKIIEFHCTGGPDIVSKRVIAEQRAKFSFSIQGEATEAQVIPTVASMSLLAECGQQSISPGQKAIGVGSQLLMAAERELWLSDVAHFTLGSNWREQVKKSKRSKWIESLDIMQSYGRMYGETCLLVSSLSFATTLQKFSIRWRTLLCQQVDRFFDDIELLQENTSLQKTEIEASFESIMMDLTDTVTTLLDCYLPDNQAFEDFLRMVPSIPVFDSICPQGFHSDVGIRLAKNVEKKEVINFLTKLASRVVDDWRDKLQSCMLQNRNTVMEGIQKWMHTFSQILGKQNVNGPKLQWLLWLSANIKVPEVQDVNGFSAAHISAFCRTFANKHIMGQKRTWLPTGTKNYTITPHGMKAFFDDLTWQQATSMMDSWIFTPLRESFSEVCEVMDGFSGQHALEQHKVYCVFLQEIREAIRPLICTTFTPMSVTRHEALDVVNKCNTVQTLIDVVLNSP